MTDLERAIKAEMRKALASLGADPELLASVDAAEKLHPRALYRFAERLGADRWLLAAIGGLHDTHDDEDVLRELRDWNAAEWEGPARRRQ
jgi:hypothetical protein